MISFLLASGAVSVLFYLAACAHCRKTPDVISCIERSCWERVFRAACINEVMTDDDANDPYLESYRHYGNRA